ncbi:MAG: FadR/GntR family transcriptional regulator, partial [Chloroflexia bacterium]
MVRHAPTPNTFARMQIPKGSELLARQIRDAILEGSLIEGEMLPSEKELMQQLDMSRATVREGLRLLEAEGLITTRPGRGGGATVHSPSDGGHTRSLALLLHFAGSTLDELFEAWQAMVPACARLAALRRTSEQVAGLHNHLRKMAEQVGDPPAFVALEVRFHMLIGHATNNAVLRIYGTSLAQLTFPQIQNVPFTPAQIDGALADCENIVEAIEQTNGTAAEQLTAYHLKRVVNNIVLLTRSTDQ